MRISDWSSDVCSSDLREDPGKEKESDCSAGARLSNGGLLAVSSVRSRHRSVSLGALGRTAPVQRPVGSVGIGPEQVGADRLREDGIVYRQRDVVAGLFADALPAGADLGPVLLRSGEHTSELQSLMRISYAVFCLQK